LLFSLVFFDVEQSLGALVAVEPPPTVIYDGLGLVNGDSFLD